MAFDTKNLDYKLSIKDSRFHLVIDEDLVDLNAKLGNRDALDKFLKKLIPGEKWDSYAPVIRAQIEARGELVLAAGGKFKAEGD